MQTHLLPDQVGISRIFANHEPLEVFLNQPTSRRTTETGRIAHGTIRRRKLDEERTEDSNTPGRSGMRKFRILGHWVGDVACDDPVRVALAMVVSAGAIGRRYEGFDVDLEEH